MLYDRIKWHYDSAVPWQDEDAVRALIPAAKRGLISDASGFRYDCTDHAEFQLPNPEWTPPPPLRGMVVRVGDGVYREPVFSTHFRIMDEMLQRGELDYCMWYILPNPNVSNQRMLDAIAGQLRESGVTWGRPGHGLSIDDEPTPYHGQLTGQTMVDFRNALQDTYQREELHYVGLYNGNYGWIENQGWQLWAPWPTSNGPLPSWTTNLVMQQWGVAGAGEVPGFPDRPVDVNHIFDAATLDRLTGRTGTQQPTDDIEAIMADPALSAQLAEFLRVFATPGGPYYLGDVWNRSNADHPTIDMIWEKTLATFWQVGNMMPIAGTEQDTIMGRVVRIQDGQVKLADSLEKLTAPTVDVDALAKALAPLLNSGTDAHAVALEVADVLGDRLATGGTEGGSK